MHYVSSLMNLDIENAAGEKVPMLKEREKVVFKADTSKLAQGLNQEKISLWQVVKTGNTVTLEYVPSRFVNGEVIAKVYEGGQYILALNDKKFETPAAGNGYARVSVEILGSKCIVKGRPDGNYDYAADITRAEYMTLLVRLLELKSSGTKNLSFSDISTKAWYTQDLLAAVEHGLITGYHDGTAKPNQKITRKEMAIISARALKLAGLAGEADVDVILSAFTDADKIDIWARGDIALATNNGLIQGYPDGTFRPEEKANRAQAAVIMKRFFDLFIK